MFTLDISDVRGKLIVLEGMDGMGKTTLAKNLAKRLEELGLDVHLTRQPYGNNENVEPFGQLTRFKKQTKLARWLTHLAAHAQQYEYEILPALAEGKTVVMDRCWWSALAYNFHGDGLVFNIERDLGIRMEMLASQSRMPDLIIFLDGNSHRPEFQDRGQFNSRVALEYSRLIHDWTGEKQILWNISIDDEVYWDDTSTMIAYDEDQVVVPATEEQLVNQAVDIIAFTFTEQPKEVSEDDDNG